MTGVEKIHILKSATSSNVSQNTTYANFNKSQSSTFSFLTKKKGETKRTYPTNYTVKNKADIAKTTGLSKEFVDRIIKEEGLRLNEYTLGGTKTIGIGHNISADKNYKYGSTITETQAYKLLTNDLIVKQKELDILTKGVNLKEGQREALLDLLFQHGYGKVQKSELIKMIQAGKIDEAVTKFEDFTNFKGKANPHISKRRLQNIHDYAKHNPTNLAISTMNNIKNKGLTYFEDKIKISKNIKSKANIEHQKNIYLKSSNSIIDKLKNKMDKPKVTQKKESFWKKIKNGIKNIYHKIFK